MRSILSTFGAVAIGITTATAQAGVVTTGTVYANTAGNYPGFPVTAMTDQSGLSTGYTSGVTDFATYIAGNPTHATSAGGGVSFLTPAIPNFPFTLDLDLGSNVAILGLALWNGSAGNDAAIDAFEVRTASVADFSVSTLVGSFRNPIGSSGPEPATVFDLTDTVGQFVRITVNSYHGNLCCAAIGEVAFDAGNAVPIPATLPLAGLGLIALVLARRRRD